MKIHVCLISGQAAPNLLPALDPDLKPDKAVLIITGNMKAKAENLTQVLKENGVQIEQVHLSNEHDFLCTQSELLELAYKLEDHDVFLNITGGTKLMSVAAQSIATLGKNKWLMFYVDADTDQVIWLNRDDEPPHPLRQHLKLRHYLQSYGFKFGKTEHPHATSAQQKLLQTLVTQAENLQEPLGTLNYLAQVAENSGNLSVTLDRQQLDSRSLETLLRHFQDAKALEVRGDSIHFADTAGRNFVKGGWLELHAMQTIHQLSGRPELGIRDKAIGLEVTDIKNETKNELDIALMARNRLFVIECKTGRIDKPHSNSQKLTYPKANDAMFKLSENCKRMGGQGARGMLLSYRKLPGSAHKLANSLGITIVSGAEIARLSEKIQNWIIPSRS